MDVPRRKVHENPEGLRSEYGRPEASMAEGYLKEECLGFITEYLQSFDVVQRHVWDAEEEYGDAEEVLEDIGKPYMMSPELRDAVHQYVLKNVAAIQPLYI
jgi:hypothetical protein